MRNLEIGKSRSLVFAAAVLAVAACTAGSETDFPRGASCDRPTDILHSDETTNPQGSPTETVVTRCNNGAVSVKRTNIGSFMIVVGPDGGYSWSKENVWGRGGSFGSGNVHSRDNQSYKNFARETYDRYVVLQ